MADLTFRSYEVQDDGIDMVFTNFDPGPGLPNDYAIRLTDAELAGVTTLAQLRTLVTNKLKRKLQAEGIGAKLNPLIGGVITI